MYAEGLCSVGVTVCVRFRYLCVESNTRGLNHTIPVTVMTWGGFVGMRLEGMDSL